MTHLVFSLRTNAWVGTSVPYTNSTSRAQKFSRDEALEICRAHALDGKVIAFPVALEDLKAVTE